MNGPRWRQDGIVVTAPLYGLWIVIVVDAAQCMTEFVRQDARIGRRIAGEDNSFNDHDFGALLILKSNIGYPAVV
jgi:hypothetical protein